MCDGNRVHGKCGYDLLCFDIAESYVIFVKRIFAIRFAICLIRLKKPDPHWLQTRFLKGRISSINFSFVFICSSPVAEGGTGHRRYRNLIRNCFPVRLMVVCPKEQDLYRFKGCRKFFLLFIKKISGCYHKKVINGLYEKF